MKTLLLKVIVLFIAFFIMGDAIGMQQDQAAGVGAVAIIGAAVSTAPKHVLRAGYDISEVISQLGEYWRVYSRTLWREMTNDLELESYCRMVPMITDEYVTTRSENTEYLQPFQKGWTPKGETLFTPHINKVRQIKIDNVIDCMDDLYRSYLSFMADESRKRDEWPLVRYIWEFHIIPAVRHELDILSGTGVYAAPTPGTAGASIDSVDGFLTIIANAIGTGDITPIITGVTTQANAVANFELFVDSLPEIYQKVPGTIFCSPTLARYYKRDYRNKFGGQNDPMAKNQSGIDASNKQVVGVNAYTGSQRMEFTPADNKLVMYDKIYAPDSLQVQLDKRDVCLLADFKRGYGYGTLKSVFTNDQP